MRADVADDSTAALGNALAMNETLKCLDFSDNHITSTGWRKISNCLAPTSTISEQELMDSRSALPNIGFVWFIDDEGVEALSTLVADHMNTISSLCLTGNHSISANGWNTVANVLRPSYTSKQKMLRVGSSNQDTGSYPITNEVISDLVTALARNSSLGLLELYDVDDDVDSAMEALLTV